MTNWKMLYLGFMVLCTFFTCREPNIETGASSYTENLVQISLDEGTNMAAAISPDGKQIIVDLHGTLWLTTIEGGRLESLTPKTMDARQPHWARDGSQCVFQGFEEGNWHLYILGMADRSIKKVSTGLFDHREPFFLPDGRILFSSDRSGNYDLWIIGSKDDQLIQLTNTKDYDEYGPASNFDGTSIIYIAKQGPEHEVRMLDSKGVKSRTLYQSEKSLFAPVFSRDEHTLFFNEVSDLESGLWEMDLTDPVAAPILISGMEDVFPFRAFQLDKEILYTSSGKIRRRHLELKTVAEIPFKADVTLSRHRYQHKRRNFDQSGPQVAKGIYQPSFSPDATSIAFIALGDLWISDKDGTSTRLTNDPYIQVSPAWSGDGQYLAYASDAGGENGIWRYSVTTKKIERIGLTNGLAVGMDWSEGNGTIAYTLNFGPRNGQLFELNIDDGVSTKIGRSFPFSVSAPSWSSNGELIALSVLQPYSNLYREGINRIVLARADGSGIYSPTMLPHWSFGMRGNDGPNWSPVENKLLFLSQGFLWLVITDSRGHFTSEPQQLTKELTDSPSWSGDGRKILFQTPNGMKIFDVETLKSKDQPINLDWERHVSNQSVLIQAGDIFNGLENALHKNQDIIIEGHRIVEIEAHDPNRKADITIDARGKYIMPGLIDIHAHQGSDLGESLGRKWLAWGVTSTRDPATNPYDALNRKEGQQAGSLVGPRIFFTGSPLDGNRVYYGGTYALQNKQQLNLELERAETLDYDMVKTYVRLNDPWQQEIIEKAHEIGIPVSSHELYPAVSYGIDAVEHILGTSRRGYNTKMSRIFNSYEDVTDLIALSGMKFTPTIGIYVAYEYMLAKDPKSLEDQRISTLVPPYSIETTREKIKDVNKNPHQWETRFNRAAKMLTDINNKGGHIVSGTDSPIVPYGFGLHIEIEAYQAAGLSTFEALQTTTVNAAKGLGASDDLGSIEVGKLADLLILQSNPLDDVSNTRDIESVMIDGKIYSISDLLRLPTISEHE